MEAAVELRDVGKSFGAARVLEDIGLTVVAGEVHALVGENGAGKSTVGKIIGGYYTRDAGTLRIFGEDATSWSPRAALGAGVAMIHQELQLVPEMTVAQNVFLGIEENLGGLLRGTDRARFDALEAHCGFGLDPDAKVAGLRIAERQKVEIMRALAREARVIIMDEPTSSLTADEAEKLHQVIAWLKSDGRTVIYVTHFLDHVLANCDKVTIMRDGRIVRTGPVGEETKARLVEAMLGEPADIAYPELPPPPPEATPPLLSVEDISSDAGVGEVSLVVRPGEIVALIGLVGSGRSEVARAIFGADRITSGNIVVDGERFADPLPSRSLRQKIAFVPEDRRKQGLVLTQRTRPNMSLPHLGAISRLGLLDTSKERRQTRDLIEHFNIVPPLIDGEVAYYSGGNQQKVLLSKWVFEKPRLVILDEPSRGVDIGARRRIHDFVVELANTGTAVLLISSDLEEALALSHRGYLMSNGRIIEDVDCRKVTLEQVLFRLFNVAGKSAGVEAHG